MGTGFGCYLCVEGHDYRVASEHEVTVVGHIAHAAASRKGSYRYEFSVNGVKMDDYSKLCATPLTPDACDNYGPVLVYYSYEPYPNSLLEDFAVASSNAFGVGKFLLAVGLPLFVLPSVALAILRRRNKKEDDIEDENGRSKHNGEPDEIHIVPGE
jgi:hypothetical protein